MKPKILPVTMIFLLIIVVSLIFALSEFKLVKGYIPLDITSHNMTLGIVSVASYEVSGVPVEFGTALDPASSNSAALSNVNINNTGNVDLNISVSGSEFFNHSSQPMTYYFSIQNAVWNTINDPGSSTTLTSTYANVGQLMFGDPTEDIYFWVSIPANQYSGLYNSTLYIEVTAI